MLVSKNLREILQKIKPVWGFITDELPEEYLFDVDSTLSFYKTGFNYKIELNEYSKDEEKAEFILYIFNDEVVYEADIKVFFKAYISVSDIFYYKDKRPDLPPRLGRTYKCH